MSLPHIPEGYHTVTPYLLVEDISELIEFLKNAFNAEEHFSLKDEDGKPSHAEIKIGDSIIMMGNTREDWKAMPTMLYLYVEDVDATYKQAISAGGESIMEPSDQFYGDRSGAVKDAFDNQWWIATHKETLSTEEIERRKKEQQAAGA